MDMEESQRSKAIMKTACEEGDFKKVFELIKVVGIQDKPCQEKKKRKPLHYAAFHGNLEVVRTLVEEYGCYPRSADTNRCTPLHYACYGGHKDVVKYLVTEQSHCDPKVKDNEGTHPLQLVYVHESDYCYTYNYSLVSYSLQRHKELTSGHYEVAKFLLTESGCNLTGSKKHAPTLVLHLACRYGTVDFVQLLIEQKNCHPNSQNKDQDAPVHLASKYGNVEILRYLVEVQYCSLMQQNKDGNTPLHLACMFQHLETMKYLVEKQQDLIMVVNHDKALPAHVACCQGSLKLLLLP